MHRAAIPSNGSIRNHIDDPHQHQFEFRYQQQNRPAAESTTVVPPPLRSALNGPSATWIARPLTPGNEPTDTPHLNDIVTTGPSKTVDASPELQSLSSVTPGQSNSISGPTDRVSNLNRWSESTVSSKGSHSHKKSNSFSRRISLGGSGGFRAPSQDASNKRSNKSRSSDTQSPTRPPESTTLSSLPPIITLPSLLSNHESSTPLRGASNNTPSTANILSAAVHAAVPDYFGKAWETSRSDTRESSQSGPSNREPSSSGGYRLSSSDTRTSTSTLTVSPSKSQRRDGSPGHSRPRSATGRDSGGTSQSDRRKSKDGGSKPPSQKAMLSKALQKANTAVLLDNAQNFEGAMQAYSEACSLLQQVMNRSSGDEDRRKLEAIRNTYTSRIKELEKIAPHLANEGKALPARPGSNQGSYNDSPPSPNSASEESVIIETATVARIVGDDIYAPEGESRQIQASELPQRRESLMPVLAYDKLPARNVFEHYREQKSARKVPVQETILETNNSLFTPSNDYLPPPLSPRRLPSRDNTPGSAAGPDGNLAPESANSLQMRGGPSSHNRAPSAESMSWLDTIDESGGSTASSVHSRTSSLRVRRKHIRAASGATEAEFDAALDAAVEAAYNEGFEPEESYKPPIIEDYDNDVVLNARRKVELAKERVRQTEREEAVQLAKEKERTRLLQDQRERYGGYDDSDGNESEEEERMLEEMTRGYVMDEFEFGLQSKSALPRESDSSGFSGRTWNSSIGSNPTTAGTNLSTVMEKSFLPDLPPPVSSTPPPPHPPPSQALPPPPPPPLVQLPGLPPMNNSVTNAQTVRSRRLSGQNAKQLKIETISRVATPPSQPPSMPPPRAPLIAPPFAAGIASSSIRQMPSLASRPPIPAPQTIRQASSPFPGPSPDVITPPTPTLAQAVNDDFSTASRSGAGSPVRPQSRSALRKNFSSTSLKNIKSNNLSVSGNDDGSTELSPNTPMSGGFGTSPASKEPPSRLPAMPALPTSIATAFKDKMNGTAQPGGIFLFESDIHSPNPTSPAGTPSAGAPIPLEPCPKEFLLRPFWLMRALYQTMCHPRGGYLSTKLFIPRDVWRVKGVKIKGLEDKIANCDLLTAALQKLAKVDTYDADSVLDEMQAMETVLEQVQMTLTKKLGSEVGVQGSGLVFKESGNTGEADPMSGSKTPSASKSSFSWRRLRSKNSGAALSSNYNAKGIPAAADVSKDNVTMATLPMTGMTTIRFAKRDVSSVQFSGPNANYMAALARLFDAAQAIDQIARQVEDPGLRHADKTQVGLELSTRHAAEFFGFYICRFVLTDVSLLLDKFIKRGSEWVVV